MNTRLSGILLSFVYLFICVGFSLGSLSVYATTCDEDCHDRCRQCVSYDIGFAKDEKCIIEPTCHTQCEIEKKTACALNTPVPAIPRTPTFPSDYNQACKAPYEAITHSTIAFCANWSGRADDLDLIERAKEQLVQLGFAEMSEFTNVDIRWCELNGSGMVPENNRVLLHPNLKSDQKYLVSTLGHELYHLRQYRDWGGDDFKCRYSKELASGKGQGRDNYIERDAYEYEDRIKAAWNKSQMPGGQSNNTGDQQNQRIELRPIEPRPTLQPRLAPIRPPQIQMSQRCGTPIGACFIYGVGQIGDSCWCPSRGGPVQGQLY